MKVISLFLLAIPLFISCHSPKQGLSADKFDANGRVVDISKYDSLTYGSTYLPVYSEVYERTQNDSYALTSTVSIHNISSTDTCFIVKADYFTTAGKLVKRYLSKPIKVAPLETLEIIIAKNDNGGGSGGNFVFDWATSRRGSEPLFEALMISTTGQQGISFIVRGVKR